MQAAATESMKLETQITELRDAPGRQSRETKRKLEDLEKQLAKKRKKARGVKKTAEARDAKRRSEAASAVAELRRKLAQARRDARAGQAKLVEELGKELATAEQRLERLEANDRKKEELDGLSSRLDAVVARTPPGTALARDVETCCTALTTRRRLKRSDTSTEDEVLAAAVDALEKAQRGGGSLRDIVEKALEAMKSGGHGRDVGRKRRQSQEVSESASRSLQRDVVDATPSTRRRVASTPSREMAAAVRDGFGLTGYPKSRGRGGRARRREAAAL